VEISFYHHAHTWVNNEPKHGQHDPKSMAHMSQYVPQMSQALKDHIYPIELRPHHQTNVWQTHLAIWWARVNVRETMTRDDFIRQQDIAYLD